MVEEDSVHTSLELRATPSPIDEGLQNRRLPSGVLNLGALVIVIRSEKVVLYAQEIDAVLCPPSTPHSSSNVVCSLMECIHLRRDQGRCLQI